MATEALAKKEKSQFEITITDKSMNAYLQSVIGNKTQEFISNIIALVNNNQGLANIPPQEIINAGLQATAIGLPLEKSLGNAYVIPYKGHAQFQVGKDGYIQLGLRTEKYKTINCCSIMSIDELKNKNYLYGEPYEIFRVKQERKQKNLKEIIGYCAIIVTTWGFEKSLFVTTEEMKAFCQRYSESYKNDKYGKSLWNTDFNVMAEKTVLKNLLKHYGIKSPAMNMAIISDQAVITNYDTQTFDYIDNPASNIEETTAEVINEPVKESPKEVKQLTPQQEEYKTMYLSGVFNDTEKKRYNILWAENQEKCLSEMREAYNMKTSPENVSN